MSENKDGQPSPGEDNGLYTYDSFSGSKKTGERGHFLWWCAGAHQKILKQFPSEQSKYEGLGGVLLATFILACLSSGYAVFSIFDNKLWALCFAVVWGLIIFNFDRFLVSTMRKYGISKRKQYLMAVPRLLLAILIGLTIARPLELKIFEKEVAVKMVENLHHKIQRNDSLIKIDNNAQLQTAQLEKQRLIDRRALIEDSLKHLQSAYVQEADGTGGSGRRGIEKLTHLKMDAYEQAVVQYTPELAQIKTNMMSQDSLINSIRSGIENKRAAYETNAGTSMGFLEKNKALSDLSDEESSVWWTSLLISLLIMLIEIGPVLSKLIMPVGPYDVALAKEELMQMASDENDMRKGKDIQFEKKKLFYKKQREMSDELVDKLTKLQQKHIDEELDKWERGEWNERDHRASMDEVLRKIKEKYQMDDENLI